MGSMSVWHWVVVALVVLLLFGRGKISEFMGDAAKGIKAFKKGLAEEEKPAEPAAAQPAGAPAAPADGKTIDHKPVEAPAQATATAQTPRAG